MKAIATGVATLLLLTVVPSAWGQDEPSEAERQAIAKIRSYGGQVLEVAQNDPRLDVAFHLSDQEISDAALETLPPLAGRLAKLNLRGTKVTDAGLVHLSPLTELEKLHLEKTGITDAGLEHLKPLKKLVYLNLYGTKVTDAGLQPLKELTALKKLFVWQTEVTPAGVEELQKALPELEIIAGVDFAKPAEEKPEEPKEEPKADKPAEEKAKEEPPKEEKPKQEEKPDGEKKEN